MAQQKNKNQNSDVYDEVFVEVFDGNPSPTTEKWSVWTTRGGQIAMGDGENDDFLKVHLSVLEAVALARLLMREAREQAATIASLIEDV